MRSQISLKGIYDRLMRYPAMEDLDFEAAIAWSLDVIQLIGTEEIFKQTPATLYIQNYRCELPKDFVNMNTAMKVIVSNGVAVGYTPLGSSTDPYITAYDSLTNSYRSKLAQDTYNIQDTYMFTSFETGVVQISYKAVFLDSEGMLAIPDYTATIKAIEYYIKQEYFRGLNEIGRIPDKILHKAEQEYTWYIGQARTERVLASLDDRQTFSNVASRLILNDEYHSENFANLGNKELLIKH